MAYSQYSRTAAAVPTDDEHEVTQTTAGGSSSLSNWQHLLASNTRKRAMGRVKIGALPQRVSIRGTPEKSTMPLPQRTAKRSPPTVSAMPQRITPQRPCRGQDSTDFGTPEMPQLKTLSMKPQRSPMRGQSPKVSVRPHRSPQRAVTPKQPQPQRSHSTPPVLKRPPKIVEDASRPTVIVNHKSYYIMERIGKGGSSEVFQVLEAKGNRMRAVKRVDLSDITSAEKEAFVNEVNLLKRLQGSRRVIKLIDYEMKEESNELFVVMEHGERDLANLLKEVSTSEEGRFGLFLHILIMNVKKPQVTILASLLASKDQIAS